MAIKKSELYSSLWKSCDELRGGMDASQYKDYVLVLLFIKYISDKYAGVPYAPITVPKGSSFKDMVALKGDIHIGDKINKQIIEPIAEANKLSEMPDFANTEKLGSGKSMVDRLTKLIAIFESPAIDFSKNRADGDDILGDAYEYLMRNFATESGKSKGQFYTPAEVSRIMAKIIGVNSKSSPSTTVYDPTCGSGSLLLKVADEAERKISIYGQENETATAGLARMNMILHNNPTAEIRQGNTLADPKWADNNRLRTFDYVVANPPFSYKSWSNGVDAKNDIYGRFKDFGIPPNKNGDYAFLLHILKSLKTKGKGAVILPHGVLFRGNGESDIRKNIIRKGYIKGIIGLPPNLFYGTPIAACILILDKENADNRKGIFVIDASKGFVKDGSKNRLREQDIHKIVDVFNNQREIDKYSRMVSHAEIEEKNGFSLNMSRYIDSQESEDIQDIEAHLLGGIPEDDIDALQNYWDIHPSLRKKLFGRGDRAKYCKLLVEHGKIKEVIFSHPEFIDYAKKVDSVFASWRKKNISVLKAVAIKDKPKKLIHEVSEDLLSAFSKLALIDNYDVYQNLMVYWSETMQDDVYEIVVDGWEAGKKWKRKKKESKSKNGGTKQKEIVGIEGIEGILIPSQLMIEIFFAKVQAKIDDLTAKKEDVSSKINELRQEHGGDEGLLSEVVGNKDKITKKSIQARIKKLNKDSADDKEELGMLNTYLGLLDNESSLNSQIKSSLSELEKKIIKKYPTLSEDEIKKIVVEDKWLASLKKDVKFEMNRISRKLTGRIKELAERYENPLPKLEKTTKNLTNKVERHLKKMGYKW